MRIRASFNKVARRLRKPSPGSSSHCLRPSPSAVEIEAIDSAPCLAYASHEASARQTRRGLLGSPQRASQATIL